MPRRGDSRRRRRTGLSLNKALEQLVTTEKLAFSFVTPASSLAQIQKYLENSGGVGVKTS